MVRDLGWDGQLLERWETHHKNAQVLFERADALLASGDDKGGILVGLEGCQEEYFSESAHDVWAEDFDQETSSLDAGWAG